ncbi:MULTISPECIES: hypoxanthine phosphoribosyltransferase [Spiroplasma]|uniref:Hypoxanthine phosphoribosyltransferase n=1 Tax=Spiroplasma phoeniceum P40 TaxID=1276259 RepID=A0A345DND0_9MOLU|nr:hypoxanthine phosphoribosyltransferase [Spiroplasma phoeniceum]AXF95718.1 hypoxanthine-guanine phosphoribosyltransferase [Spiroplasma phoeniceum P40]MBH8624298.1 hypoxanthine phosphoribosyltransferase [Spiroplasma sp. Moj]
MQIDKLELYLPEDKIQNKIKDYAEKLNKLYEGKTLYCIGLLNGALFFMSDLLKQLKIQIVIDTMSISSYIGTQSTNKLTIHKDISKDITGQDVLLIEDLIDTGKTLSAVIEQIQAKKPNSLQVVCLADKIAMHPNFNYPYDALFIVPNEFIVGYGFDYNDQFRQLPNVYIWRGE